MQSLRTRNEKFLAILPILFISLGVLSSFAAAQPRTGTGGGTAAPEPTRMRKDAPVKKETIYIRKTVTPTTGQLAVATDPPGAVILLEPLDPRNRDSRQAQIPRGRRDWAFNDLKPGQYRVAATKAEYHQYETTVTIRRNKAESITLNLEPISYKVTINTNVDAGELRYRKDGETPRTLDFHNRTISLDLTAGDYVVRISAEGYGYEPAEQKLPIRESRVVELPLKRIESTSTLAPMWTNAELKTWEMPSAWRADSNRTLLVKGRGVAIPRDARNRYYVDFKLVSNVKMLNGVAISFALRALDSRNYYLLQITGKNSDEPNFVQLFTVKNDVEQRLRAIPISKSIAAAWASGQFFTVQIKVKGYEIYVNIIDQIGAPYTLGVLTDPDHNFPIGAVGIAVRNNEENVIEQFTVCTGKCLEQ